jgi:hypothetical protein
LLRGAPGATGLEQRPALRPVPGPPSGCVKLHGDGRGWVRERLAQCRVSAAVRRPARPVVDAAARQFL